MFPFIPVDRFLTQLVNKAPLKIDFSFISDFARHEKPKGMQEFGMPELWVKNLSVENHHVQAWQEFATNTCPYCEGGKEIILYSAR